MDTWLQPSLDGGVWGADLYRETGDTDLGVPPLVIEELDVVGRLRDLGYEVIAGNRFSRPLDDVPVSLASDAAEKPAAMVDVLIPAYTSRARQDRSVGVQLITTEVPGLATALRRAPVELDLQLHRLNGSVVDVRIAFPDEVSAMVLKAYAAVVRSKATDVVDLWRCLEVGVAAGLGPDDLQFTDGQEAAAAIRRLFDDSDAPGMRSLVEEQRLTEAGAKQRFTRVRALIDRVLGEA